MSLFTLVYNAGDGTSWRLECSDSSKRIRNVTGIAQPRETIIHTDGAFLCSNTQGVFSPVTPFPFRPPSFHLPPSLQFLPRHFCFFPTFPRVSLSQTFCGYMQIRTAFFPHTSYSFGSRQLQTCTLLFTLRDLVFAEEFESQWYGHRRPATKFLSASRPRQAPRPIKDMPAQCALVARCDLIHYLRCSPQLY